MNKERVWNEENLPLAKWLIDKTNTKDYRIGNLSGMKHPKVDGNLLKTVGGREELVSKSFGTNSSIRRRKVSAF